MKIFAVSILSMLMTFSVCAEKDTQDEIDERIEISITKARAVNGIYSLVRNLGDTPCLEIIELEYIPEEDNGNIASINILSRDQQIKQLPYINRVSVRKDMKDKGFNNPFTFVEFLSKWRGGNKHFKVTHTIKKRRSFWKTDKEVTTLDFENDNMIGYLELTNKEKINGDWGAIAKCLYEK